MDKYMCPYIDKEKATLFETEYFCNFDGMEFDSMTVHCQFCEVYKALLNRIRVAIMGTEEC